MIPAKKKKLNLTMEVLKKGRKKEPSKPSKDNRMKEREPYTLQELRATVVSVYQQWSTSRMPQPERR